jgi:hypothetical protein
MGLNWSNAKLIKNNTTVMCNSRLPVGDDTLWNLWKSYKEYLKSDGFNISKYEGVWRVSYFYELPEGDSMESGKWKEIFDKKISKYQILIDSK